MVLQVAKLLLKLVPTASPLLGLSIWWWSWLVGQPNGSSQVSVRGEEQVSSSGTWTKNLICISQTNVLKTKVFWMRSETCSSEQEEDQRPKHNPSTWRWSGGPGIFTATEEHVGLSSALSLWTHNVPLDMELNFCVLHVLLPIFCSPVFSRLVWCDGAEGWWGPAVRFCLWSSDSARIRGTLRVRQPYFFFLVQWGQWKVEVLASLVFTRQVWHHFIHAFSSVWCLLWFPNSLVSLGALMRPIVSSYIEDHGASQVGRRKLRSKPGTRSSLRLELAEFYRVSAGPQSPLRPVQLARTSLVSNNTTKILEERRDKFFQKSFSLKMLSGTVAELVEPRQVQKGSQNKTSK